MHAKYYILLFMLGPIHITSTYIGSMGVAIGRGTARCWRAHQSVMEQTLFRVQKARVYFAPLQSGRAGLLISATVHRTYVSTIYMCIVHDTQSYILLLLIINWISDFVLSQTSLSLTELKDFLLIFTTSSLYSRHSVYIVSEHIMWWTKLMF
jgi:hypothetical protein